MIRKLLLAGTALVVLSAGTANAADMAVKAPYLKAPPPAFSWTGFYVGVDGLVDFANSQGNLTSLGPTPYSFPVTGAGGGGYVGGNYQFSWFVVGLEGDWQYTNSNVNGNNGAAFGGAPTFTVNTTIVDYGSVRGRLGIAGQGDLFGRALLYGTAGWAWGKYNTSYAPTGVAVLATDGVSKSGFTGGFGLEYALSDNLILRGEYRFTDLGTTSFSGPGGVVDSGNKVWINDIRYGISYKFGGGGPVFANY
jgi:outer membrane immunogenic protein